MKTLKEWGICKIQAPRSEVFVDQPRNSEEKFLLLEIRNSWLMVSLQISALESFLDFVLHFKRQVSLYDDESIMHVDCQKRFPMYHANSMFQVVDFGRGSASHTDLEQLLVYLERGIIFYCKSILNLEIRWHHIIHSLLQFLHL